MSPAAKRARGRGAVVAIVNTNDDLVRVLREALIDQHFNVVTLHIRDIKAGRQDFSEFLEVHDPEVVIYDIAIPYADNWTFLQSLRKLPAAKGRKFVITTVNQRALEKKIGPNEAVEILGAHPDDLDPVIEVVHKKLAAE